MALTAPGSQGFFVSFYFQPKNQPFWMKKQLGNLCLLSKEGGSCHITSFSNGQYHNPILIQPNPPEHFGGLIPQRNP